MDGGREKEEAVAGNQSSVISESAEEERRVENNDVLRFLDSVDDYLLLIDSLSSTLRQGWLELASARYSMGASRINTALLDHKDHPAATSLEVNHNDAGSIMQSPQFTLHKWTSPDNPKSPSGEAPHRMDCSCTPVGNAPESNRCASNGSPRAIDNSVQKERSKLLSMFGTLVSPKLRSSQLSFETALETLVELANMRSSMLLASDKVKKEMESTMS